MFSHRNLQWIYKSQKYFQGYERYVLLTRRTVPCAKSIHTSQSNNISQNKKGKQSVAEEGHVEHHSHSQDIIGKSLYKQLIRWCKNIGGEVPLDPLPPLKLGPNLIHSDLFRRLLTMPSTNDETVQIDWKKLSHLMNANKETWSIDHQSIVTVNLETVEQVLNTVRLIFALNAKTSIPSDSADDHSIKNRISFGFQSLRSLNDLNAILSVRKTKRQNRYDRNGVTFCIGEVVKHKRERWRGVIVGWNRASLSELTSKKTSLTTKKFVKQTTEDSKSDHSDVIVQYNIIPDSGDLHLLQIDTSMTDAKLFPVVDQQEIEVVDNELLRRIRSNGLVEEKFTRYDPASKCFLPNPVLAYEYPSDQAKRTKNSNPMTNQWLSKAIVKGARLFAQKINTIISHSPAPQATILTSIVLQLNSLSENDEIDTDNHRPDSIPVVEDVLLFKLALSHLRTISSVIEEISELLWQRRIALIYKHKVRYSLGTIIKHKQYGYRGVVVGWDPRPRVDVSGWDDVQHIHDDVNQMPFYHIIPDRTDMLSLFGGEKYYRYVCEENLVLCPNNETMIDVEFYEKDWRLQDQSLPISFIAPDVIKFKYAEQLGTHGEAIVACISRIHSEISTMLKAINDSPTAGKVTPLITTENLLLMLQWTGSIDDAMVIEEAIKHIWKAHDNEELRWKLEDGTSELLMGHNEKALTIFNDVVTDDPLYFEALYKKALCHYLVGQNIVASKVADDVLKLNAKHYQALSLLGLANYDLKNYQKSAVAFRKCLLLNPWSPASSRFSSCLDLLKKSL